MLDSYLSYLSCLRADPNQAGSAAIPHVRRLILSISIASLLLILVALMTLITLNASAVAASSDADSIRGVVARYANGDIKVADANVSRVSSVSRVDTAPNTTTPQPTPECGLQWRVVRAPTPVSTSNGLSDVVAISADDVWAVGSYNDGTRGRTLTMHWDGSRWSHISSATVTTGTAYLAGVDALSSDNVWAVGERSSGGVLAGPICLHWNGAQWGIVPMPEDYTNSSLLRAVHAIAPDDIWAVGTRHGNRSTLTMHWDGTEWSIVPSPNVENGDQNNELFDVSAVGPDDVWAVGYYFINGRAENLIMHWDGTEWSIVPSPNPSPNRQNTLHGVAAISSDDVWAVGQSNIGGHTQTVMLHWDGNEWTRKPSPNPSIESNYVETVRARASNDVWAVGYFCCSPAGSLTLHWDGVQWSHVPSPNVSSSGNILIGVAPVSGRDVWAVGYYSAPQAQVFIERYSDPCGTPSPSPSPTATATIPTITATRSATPATVIATNTAPPTAPTATGTASSTSTVTRTTPTAISTPTTCSLTFSDVPQGHTFHGSVLCLACRGIISGYADGTFRPDNLVTRGQLAKIVSNAAGFTEDPGDRIFEDVPVGHAFYEWINRLTNRGYMSGYNCGSPGEPCINNRPYFRPFANATRAQTSKIVSNAARYNDPPQGQTFEDVPPSHPFYTEIQRLASRGIMGGYNCGSPGEPCVPPGNRAYFRPYNNVTRGQSAKIVANAFYPDCQALTTPR